MRIIVVSDTHGNYSKLEDVLFQQPRADYFIHLGDGEREFDEVQGYHQNIKFLSVAGNCDFASSLPKDAEIVLCEKRIYFTHGHKYGVKSGYGRVICEALRRNADILLFGHTHVAMTAYENGLYIMNPGSLGHPQESNATYGIIDITKAGIVTNIVEV